MSNGLEVRNLSVRYGKAQALKGVDLYAPPGKITAVVGANGAGKSSLLLGLYGSVAASGSVLVNGHDVAGLPPARRAKSGVAIVPQGRQLFPRLTVRENLQVMAEALRLPHGAVDVAIDRFPRLRERERNLAGVLSGGEQQMLVVTRALMGDPKVLLLDEMNTGLAPVIVQDLLERVAELARAGTIIVIAEPSIAMVRDRIDRGYVLVRGQVTAIEEGGGHALDAAYQREMGVSV
ncbi:MAG: ABC transporter ATP-binding protein [Nocardiopsaceae bacterium]|nr:ABC transporter ATP-binding protein [Nocardiopsaceae bacterium]